MCGCTMSSLKTESHNWMFTKKFAKNWIFDTEVKQRTQLHRIYNLKTATRLPRRETPNNQRLALLN